ncbi:helix-turn-helix transcriptional regulator [Paenibacillus sp. FA6]|uniref:helix-turn-helix transcriptional regulator n=1 Tax=Paenibacillus sp. FA6 TaxID=3413029 RepID=UPI003F659816
MQISRLFEIVYILLDKRTTTAKELAEHFEVSTRTIFRDIDALSSAGIPVYSRQGKGGGLSLLDNFVLNKSLLSEHEQNEILIALQSLTATEYPDIKIVLSKLSSMFNKDKSNWIEVDFSPWGSNISEKEKFNTLKSAIINSWIITFEYYNSSGVKSSRIVEPAKLTFKDKSWYLQGFCLTIKKYRTFKINRIIGIQVTGDNFIQKFTDELSIDIKEEPSMLIDIQLKISSEGAYRVYDEFDERDVVGCEDGSFMIATSIPKGDWLYHYILSFGTAIEVIEPESLRNIILVKLETMINNIKPKS